MITFQKEAQEALNAETPDSEKLEQLIEFSATMDVDLVEIPRLKQVGKKGHYVYMYLVIFLQVSLRFTVQCNDKAGIYMLWVNKKMPTNHILVQLF